MTKTCRPASRYHDFPICRESTVEGTPDAVDTTKANSSTGSDGGKPVRANAIAIPALYRSLDLGPSKGTFRTSNTTIQQVISITKAQEMTAHLRPNPDFTLSADGTQIAPSRGVWQPFAERSSRPVSYLFERRKKRGLRYEAAKQSTAIGIAQQSDSERTLLFNLRTAFTGILQPKLCCGLRKTTSLLRQSSRSQCRSLSGRRHFPHRPRSPRTCARSIRIRLANRLG